MVIWLLKNVDTGGGVISWVKFSNKFRFRSSIIFNIALSSPNTE